VSETRALEIASASVDDTRRIGSRLGQLLRQGDVVLLNGDLGAGKTTLTQGIAVGLAVEERVQSPTFTLVAEHDGYGGDGGSLRLYHLDLYRLRDDADLESFGYEQYLEPVDGVTVIEWPERAGNWLPDRYLLVDFEFVGPADRILRIEVRGGSKFDVTGLIEQIQTTDLLSEP
jgi:tRNA threonylcarbamoyladenosine biosynthesis protein TsaE